MRTSPMVILAAAAVLAAAATCAASSSDLNISSGGYQISAIGSSAKLRLQIGDGRFIQIAQDRLEETDASGNALSPSRQVSSWASTDLTWASCAGAPSTAAARVCGSTDVTVRGSTASVALQGDLTNASYYYGCGCASGQAQVFPHAGRFQILQPFDDNYHAEHNGYCYTCRDRCVTCAFSSPSSASCTATVPAAGGSCASPSLLVSTAPTDNATARTLPLASAAALCSAATCVCVSPSGVATACPTGGSCAAGSATVTAVGGAAVDASSPVDFTADSCQYQPVHQLKFGIYVVDWPWGSDDTSVLQWGVEVKGSGSLTAGSSGGVTTSDGLELVSNPSYVRCDSPVDCSDYIAAGLPLGACGSTTAACCVVEDGVQGGGIAETQGSKTTVTYRLTGSHGAYSVCYDPTIGAPSTSGSHAALPAAATLVPFLLALFAVASAAF